jgi:hypothetical protein
MGRLVTLYCVQGSRCSVRWKGGSAISGLPCRDVINMAVALSVQNVVFIGVFPGYGLRTAVPIVASVALVFPAPQ